MRGRRPVVAVVTGATEQVTILPDEAAPNPVNYRFYKKLHGLFMVVTTKREHKSKAPLIVGGLENFTISKKRTQRSRGQSLGLGSCSHRALYLLDYYNILAKSNESADDEPSLNSNAAI